MVLFCGAVISIAYRPGARPPTAPFFLLLVSLLVWLKQSDRVPSSSSKCSAESSTKKSRVAFVAVPGFLCYPVVVDSGPRGAFPSLIGYSSGPAPFLVSISLLESKSNEAALGAGGAVAGTAAGRSRTRTWPAKRRRHCRDSTQCSWRLMVLRSGG